MEFNGLILGVGMVLITCFSIIIYARFFEKDQKKKIKKDIYVPTYQELNK